jgi:hypothetical protein
MADDAAFCDNCGAKTTNVRRVESTRNEDENVFETITRPVAADRTAERKEELEQKMAAAGDQLKRAGKTGMEYAKAAGQIAQEKAVKAKAEMDKANARMDKCFVKMTDGEVIIRNYKVSRVLFPRMQGFLMVTNKRVILYGSAFRSRIYQETQIDAIGAIDSFYGFSINWFMLIGGFILMMTQSAVTNSGFMRHAGAGSAFASFLLLVIGLALIILAFHRSMIIRIASSKATGIGIYYGKFNTYGASSILLHGRAGEDTDRMMSELGAIILDLQQSGNIAIEKWKN